MPVAAFRWLGRRCWTSSQCICFLKSRSTCSALGEQEGFTSTPHSWNSPECSQTLTFGWMDAFIHVFRDDSMVRSMFPLSKTLPQVRRFQAKFASAGATAVQKRRAVCLRAEFIWLFLQTNRAHAEASPEHIYNVVGLLVIWHLLKSKDYSAPYKSFHDLLVHKIRKLKTVAEGK